MTAYIHGSWFVTAYIHGSWFLDAYIHGSRLCTQAVRVAVRGSAAGAADECCAIGAAASAMPRLASTTAGATILCVTTERNFVRISTVNGPFSIAVNA
ncbi:MAG TPA: hypothetical protein VJT16_15885 [Streptosporangiaceae bacterium]|jgi:hypothetical protein|nr:hypothetical protein [Streptosporangiaceae bacterium]